MQARWPGHFSRQPKREGIRPLTIELRRDILFPLFILSCASFTCVRMTLLVPRKRTKFFSLTFCNLAHWVESIGSFSFSPLSLFTCYLWPIEVLPQIASSNVSTDGHLPPTPSKGEEEEEEEEERHLPPSSFADETGDCVFCVSMCHLLPLFLFPYSLCFFSFTCRPKLQCRWLSVSVYWVNEGELLKKSDSSTCPCHLIQWLDRQWLEEEREGERGSNVSETWINRQGSNSRCPAESIFAQAV